METERTDEGELTPEERQEKADEAFDELSEASVEVVDSMAKLKAESERDVKRAIAQHKMFSALLEDTFGAIKKVK